MGGLHVTQMLFLLTVWTSCRSVTLSRQTNVGKKVARSIYIYTSKSPLVFLKKKKDDSHSVT